MDDAALDRPLHHLSSSPWLGANFWSRSGPAMWRSFDREAVVAELAALADARLTSTRTFLFWPHLMPEPDRLDAAVLDRFAELLDLHQAVRLVTVPTFLVGHMSGQNWDPPWRQGRDLYTDPQMLAAQELLVGDVVARFAAHPAVAGWVVSNEMPLYGGAAAPDVVTAWAERLVTAARRAGAVQPLSLGDGAWGVEVTGVENGYRLDRLAALVDFLGPHVYVTDDDLLRVHLTAAFCCELAQRGKPVVLEEFGVSTDFASEAHAADYYRQVLAGSLLAGASGWLAWNNTDFDLPDDEPYRHHPYELHFGLVRVDGSPKPALAELTRFRAVLDHVDLSRCRRAPTRCALIVSSYLSTDYPFTDARERVALRANLLQAYAASRLADLGAAVVREEDGVPDVPLVLVASTKALTAPTWAALEWHAATGATVYVSYFAGATAFQRGLWHPDVDGFFGVRQQLRYGLVEAVDTDTVRWTLQRPLGDLAAGTVLSFPVAGDRDGRARLPVEPAGAAVVATDDRGEPALLRRRVGAGAIVLATCPIEHFAAARPAANPEDTWRLYRALAVEADALPAVTVPGAQVWTDALVRDDGARFQWFLNATTSPVSVRPSLPPGAELRSLDGAPLPEVALGPLEVEVCRLVLPGGG